MLRTSWPALAWRSITWRALVVSMITMAIVCWASMSSLSDPPRVREAPQQPGKETLAMRAAGNRTLGFRSIKFINIPSRFDRRDAAVLQAYLAGIDVEEHPAVKPSQIADVGMPPTSAPTFLKPGEKGCWRAHANIWSMMLQQKLPPVLIIESDAAWDVNIRPAMALLNKHFTRFLSELGSKPLYLTSNSSTTVTYRLPRHTSDPKDGPEEAPVEPRPIDHDPSDPWHSAHWDILSFGHCVDRPFGPSSHLFYHDPFAPPSDQRTYFGLPFPAGGPWRVVYRSGGPACTTAYAVTARGAAKLLLRTALDLDAPVDLVMRDMVAMGELVAYGAVPTVMAQWRYKAGLGMGARGGNSDIHGKGEAAVDAAGDGDGWDEAWESRSVWRLEATHPDAGFRDMALRVAWERIFGEERDIEVDLQ